jgi:hypothetical protein
MPFGRWWSRHPWKFYKIIGLITDLTKVLSFHQDFPSAPWRPKGASTICICGLTIRRAVSTRAFYRDWILRGGNFHRQWTSRKALALSNEQRQCPLPVKTALLSAPQNALVETGLKKGNCYLYQEEHPKHFKSRIFLYQSHYIRQHTAPKAKWTEIQKNFVCCMILLMLQSQFGSHKYFAEVLYFMRPRGR